MTIRLVIFALLFGFLSACAPIARVEAAGSRLFLTPASGSYSVGDTIKITVAVDSGGQAINSAEGTVTYPQDTLTFQSISTSGSIFTTWTNFPSGSATSAAFGGGLANPGYTGGSGKLFELSFKAKARGTATLAITGGKVLANDGAGTNVFSSAGGATLSIGAKATPAPKVTIASSTHPDQTKWYANRTVELTWSASSATSYATAFDQSSATIPSRSVGKTTSATETAPTDGVWYFHVASKLADGSTTTSHYRLQIDTVAPDPFEVTVKHDSPTNPSPILEFSATDSLSGIEKYTASIDASEPFEVQSGAPLPKLRPGQHSVMVVAYDRAGNRREAIVKLAIDGISPPIIIDYQRLVGLLTPIRFIGKTNPTDTIVVYLGQREVDRFVAGDRRIDWTSYRGPLRVVDPGAGMIVWEYSYNQPLSAGLHEFRFARITTSGAESVPTDTLRVRVESATITIGPYIFKTIYLIIVLVILILILLVLVWRLARKLKRMVAGHPKYGLAIAAIRRRFQSTEQEINQEIDRTIPNQSLEKESVVTTKKNLKTKIHEVVSDELDEIDESKQP